MCKWGSDIVLWVPIPAELSYTGEFRWDYKGVDSCIAPIVQALNDAGIYTASCCCGHGKADGSILLHDGREIIIKNKKEIKGENMENLISGRIVHYVLQNGIHRPAIIVHVWYTTGEGGIKTQPENGCSNMQVFMDLDEDDQGYDARPYPLTRMKTSVVYDENGAPGTWHWIEGSLEKEEKIKNDTGSPK